MRGERGQGYTRISKPRSAIRQTERADSDPNICPASL